MKWYYYLASHLVVALGFFILGYYAGGCGEVK